MASQKNTIDPKRVLSAGGIAMLVATVVVVVGLVAISSLIG